MGLMKKERMLLIIGVWAVVLPFLGFPTTWKNVLFSLTGAVIIYFAYVLYNQSKESEASKNENTETKTFENFSENNNFSEEEVKTEVI